MNFVDINNFNINYLNFGKSIINKYGSNTNIFYKNGDINQLLLIKTKLINEYNIFKNEHHHTIIRIDLIDNELIQILNSICKKFTNKNHPKISIPKNYNTLYCKLDQNVQFYTIEGDEEITLNDIIIFKPKIYCILNCSIQIQNCDTDIDVMDIKFNVKNIIVEKLECINHKSTFKFTGLL